MRGHRFRWLAMDLDQWINEDPLGIVAADPNYRRYVFNRSVALIDVNGCEPLIPPRTLPDGTRLVFPQPCIPYYRNGKPVPRGLVPFIIPPPPPPQTGLVSQLMQGVTSLIRSVPSYLTGTVIVNSVQVEHLKTADNKAKTFALKTAMNVVLNRQFPRMIRFGLHGTSTPKVSIIPIKITIPIPIVVPVPVVVKTQYGTVSFLLYELSLTFDMEVTLYDYRKQ